MEGIKIDGNIFYKKIERIDKILKSESKYNYDALVIIRGIHSEDQQISIQPKTSLFHEYLFGYEFTETLIIFTHSKVIFFLSPKKKLIIESAIKPSNYKGPNIELIIRNPKESNQESLEKILKSIIDKNEVVKIGKFTDEHGCGNLVDEWKKTVELYESKLEFKDCSLFVDEILAVKESEELENIKIASKYACFVMDNMIKKFENVIDDDKKITHEQISNDIKVLTEKPQFQLKFKEKYNLNSINPSQLEVSSLPVIQSGGKYNMQIFCQNDNNYLSSDIIICKINTRYKDYNANIIRSFMIDAEKPQQNHYKILFEAFNFLISQLVEGNKLNHVYNQVKEFIINKDNSLKDKIPDNFGYGIGLETENSSIMINSENNKKLLTGMTFNIILSLVGLKTEKGFVYSLQVADVVCLKSPTSKENYTNDVSKSLTDIYYNMEDEEEDAKDNDKMVVDSGGRRTRSTVVKIMENRTENKRKDHQLELLQRKNEEFKEKMSKMNDNDEIQISKKDITTVRSYANPSQMPNDIKPGRIYVDSKNDSVILPIFGTMVPFHISLIKNVSKNEENTFSFLRINFHTPITGLSVDHQKLKLNEPVFIRDLSYKSKDHKNIGFLFKMIKDLIKKVKVKDQEDREKIDLVAQENLITMKGKRLVLNDLTIRPNITSKKTTGVLEAHTNGFRFMSNKGEKIDIIYKNIKHIFFQPCENELIVLIHFHLFNPILVGRKKTNDVQFYREAGSQADDLDMRRRGNDFEEYEIEIRERQIREKINDEFSKFIEESEAFSKIEADVPYRDLAFTGVPFKSNITLLPTVNCLVSLIELPFLVITLDEVELVYFERVSHSIKNFDMSFIYKDLNRPFIRITAIPIENLELIKNWLDSVDILFSEGLINLNWNKIIQKIKKDPEEFINDGGWNFLMNEDSEEENEEEKNDSNFDESEYEEEESEFSEESEYSDSDIEGGDEELSEEGLDWDELEQKAARMDRDHLKRHPEDENPKNKKRGKK